MDFIFTLLSGIGVVINLIIYMKLNAMAHEVIVQADMMNESCAKMVEANEQISVNLSNATAYFKE